MAERAGVRNTTSEEGNRPLRIVRRSTGSVVTWRRAQMVLLSAQGMDVPAIAHVTFTSTDRVRDVRSRRPPCPGRPITVCPFRPGACPSWASTWPSCATCARLIRRASASRSCSTTSPHLPAKTDPRVGDRAHPNNVEPTYVPFYASRPNRHTHDRRLSEIVNRAKVA